ncbi:TPA: hypothetical protein ACH3X2_008141 [Trebouxia sp. C0005]
MEAGTLCIAKLAVVLDLAMESARDLPERSQAGPRCLSCHCSLALQHPQSQMLLHSGLRRQTLLQPAATAAALALAAAALAAAALALAAAAVAVFAAAAHAAGSAADAAHAAVQCQRGWVRWVEPSEQQHGVWAGPTQAQLQPEHHRQGQLKAQGWAPPARQLQNRQLEVQGCLVQPLRHCILSPKAASSRAQALPRVSSLSSVLAALLSG